MPANQNPEQAARDRIDALLTASGWVLQDLKSIDLQAGLGIAVREYQTDIGPADYVLFVDRVAVGVVEAKKAELGQVLTTVEEQTAGYAQAKLRWIKDRQPLPFLYESTGKLTRFTDARDPKPRSREVFQFHRPETMRSWLEAGNSLRTRLNTIPALNPHQRPAAELGLRDCQEAAVTKLEISLQDNRPRALIQMATGSGKTFTAITEVYRLLKHAQAKRILFLVDTKNLGEQAEQEFMAYTPPDDNRRFTELYTVQRLKSSYIPTDCQVCICTIQRLYSILKDEPLDEALEEVTPAEQLTRPRKPMPVVYNDRVPPEFFDFVIIDECHRSIYNLWQQVLDYFDAFLIGLTATPDNRTYAFFKSNVVSDYSHEKAVSDGVNVGNEVYTIETEVTQNGTKLVARQLIEKREKLTRERRWTQQDEDATHSARQLDDQVVVPDQIRLIVKTFRDHLPIIFPGRAEVPKTLVFAKTDSHADDIIQIVREEFGEGNAFCKKITYKAEEDPKSVLAQFRNDYYPRIAVTVDMIATGTDVRPLECLLFLRDVKSRNYFEQMKGRGTRTLGQDRPPQGHALGALGQDSLRHRRCRRGDEVAQDGQLSAHQQAHRASARSGDGCDDGRERHRYGQLIGRPARPACEAAGTGRPRAHCPANRWSRPANHRPPALPGHRCGRDRKGRSGHDPASGRERPWRHRPRAGASPARASCRQRLQRPAGRAAGDHPPRARTNVEPRAARPPSPGRLGQGRAAECGLAGEGLLGVAGRAQGSARRPHHLLRRAVSAS